MTCPHCNHIFPLTWRRYLASPTGKHRCPACGALSRLRLTGAYLAWVACVWMIFFGIAFLLTASLLKRSRAPQAIAIVACVYLAGSLAVAMLDKIYDERFRKLEKI
jgi:hypothetical protein